MLAADELARSLHVLAALACISGQEPLVAFKKLSSPCTSPDQGMLRPIHTITHDCYGTPTY